jgi:hypothetical protein
VQSRELVPADRLSFISICFIAPSCEGHNLSVNFRKITAYIVRTIPALILALLFAGQARAQTANDAFGFHRFELAATPYSFLRQGQLNLHGVGLALTTNLTPSFGIDGDFSFNRAAVYGRDGKVLVVRAGPRFSFKSGNRSTLFAHGLIGGAIVTEGSGELFSNPNVGFDRFTGFSMLIGGGVDITLKDWFSLRAVEGGYSSIYAGNLESAGWSNGFRISSGLVFRFH